MNHPTLNQYLNDVSASFRILEHPADLGIEAHGSTLEEAFAQAAVGLVSIILDPATVEPRQAKEVHLRGTDLEQLLVKWLSEIVYLYDGQGFVGKEFEIVRLTENELDAKVRGEPIDLQKHRTRLDVKAVTYHQLQIQHTDHGFRVQVYLDI
ncbi:MAG TPA: archease [Bacteroidota bacterium]|nr:archease [Bacteroidota bacterium]